MEKLNILNKVFESNYLLFCEVREELDKNGVLNQDDFTNKFYEYIKENHPEYIETKKEEKRVVLTNFPEGINLSKYNGVYQLEKNLFGYIFKNDGQTVFSMTAQDYLFFKKYMVIA